MNRDAISYALVERYRYNCHGGRRTDCGTALLAVFDAIAPLRVLQSALAHDVGVEPCDVRSVVEGAVQTLEAAEGVMWEYAVDEISDDAFARSLIPGMDLFAAPEGADAPAAPPHLRPEGPGRGWTPGGADGGELEPGGDAPGSDGDGAGGD